MKISEILGTLRTLVKAHSDDSDFSDSFLYSLLIQARAERLSQKLRKFQPLSPFNEQAICAKLEKVKFHDCSCVTVGCNVLKTEFEIPEVITTRSGLHLKVETIEGVDIPYVPASRRPIIKFSETLGNKLSYDIYNRKIVLWNNLTMPVVVVKGVFYDPSVLSELPECDAQGNETTNACFNPLDDEFPIEPDSINAVVERALQFALNTFNVPDDKINNTQTENE